MPDMHCMEIHELLLTAQNSLWQFLSLGPDLERLPETFRISFCPRSLSLLHSPWFTETGMIALSIMQSKDSLSLLHPFLFVIYSFIIETIVPSSQNLNSFTLLEGRYHYTWFAFVAFFKKCLLMIQ